MSNAYKAKILLVDDEYRILFTLKAILQKQGYEVHGCVYGHEAMAAISNEEFDLAILDYVLPDCHGDKVAAKLKEKNPSIPIVFITAYFLPSEAKRIANAWLMKPEAPTRVLDVVKRLLSGRTSSKESPSTAS